MYFPTGKELIDPFKVLEAASIRSGMHVADFGCGTLGHYVFPAAQLVGQEGRVYAVDILKSVLGGIESRMKLEGVSNVNPVWGDLERVRGISLPDESVDIGLIVNNLFMSAQQETMVRECVRMLRRGGRMIFVDWKPAGASFGPSPESRVTPEHAKNLAAAAGLTLEKDFEPGKYHWGFICVKP